MSSAVMSPVPELTLEPLVDGLLFPEGARWHDGKWYLSDMHAHRVVSATVQGEVESVAELADRPSGLGWLPDGSLLIVSMTRRQLLCVRNGETTIHADLSHLCDGFLNDMVVDGEGWAFVGGRNRAGGARAPKDSIICVSPSGQAHIAVEGMQSPNGTVVTPADGVLIIAESSQNRLTAFEKNGPELTGRETWAEFEDLHPDGICLDEEGAIWFGSPMTEEFVRAAEGGRVLAKVATPGYWAVCCALGGPDRRTLLALTATNSISNMRDLGLYEITDDSATEARGQLGVMSVEAAGVGWP